MYCCVWGRVACTTEVDVARVVGVLDDMESAAVVPCCCCSVKVDEGFSTNVTVAVSPANAVGRCASRKDSAINERDFIIAILRGYPRT